MISNPKIRIKFRCNSYCWILTLPTFPLIIASVFADDFADKATFMENAPMVKFAALFLMTYHLLLFISEMMYRLLYILPGKMYLVIRLVRFYGLD